ncbi:MAG: hypothetical protein KAI74_06370 [Kiritimatiellae bacterium]|nr:hypothetical protein [Kiritimatiellia bacterium]
MRNINRYKREARPIKDAIHWPLTNLDNEYAKLRNKKATHTRSLANRIMTAAYSIKNMNRESVFIQQLELC